MLPVAILLAFLGALFLIAAASDWWRVAREADREGSSNRPALSVHRLRRAAGTTALAFGLLAAALLVMLWVGSSARL